jgi:hypothetical protein
MVNKDIKEDKYEGWLVSTSFFKRMLAVWGHMIVLQLFIIMIYIFLILFAGIWAIM